MDEASRSKMEQKIISHSQFELHKEKYLEMIRAGAVFICPTDTIYGLSCDARNSTAVARIRDMKQRDVKPLSVWAPSKLWILKYCSVEVDSLMVLPGPYTLLVPLREKVGNVAFSAEVLCGLEVVGLRIPDHWFSSVVAELGFPLVTTSVNVSGQPFACAISEIPASILESVDFIIDEGMKSGRPSTIVNILTGERLER